MNPLIVVAIAIVIFLLLTFHSLPIAFSLGIVGFVGLVLFRGLLPAFTVIGGTPYSWGTMEALLPAPLFIFMGQLTFYSGISQDLFDAAHRWFGKLYGGVGVATTVAGAAFAACCGSGVAGTATMGAIAYPEMKRYNYDDSLATGVVVAGGSLSPIIPPSVPFIIYSYLTDTSVAKQFIAGILPGIMLAVMFSIAILIMCIRNPQLGPRGQSFPWKERLIALRGVIAMVLLFCVVIGGLLAGVFTPTEAGACGAFGAFIITLAYGRLSFSRLTNAARDAVLTTCFVITLIIGATMFNSFLAVIGIPDMFYHWINSLTMPRFAILALILFFYIPIGMFMDIGAILLITIPIIVPAFVALGFDVFMLGVVTTLLAGLGMMSPPVGLISFVASQVCKVPLWTVFRGITPFAILTVIGATLLCVFPQIATYLIKFMAG